MVTDISTQDIKSKLSLLENNYQINKKPAKKVTGCSVIIPVFNQWEELLYCIKFLSRQERQKRFEIIVVDDGSSKVVNLDKILKFSNKFKINIFRLEENVGVAASRNVGICKAKYDLLVFLDSDMVVPENFLFEHIKAHERFSKIISVSLRKHIHFDLQNKKISANIYRVPSYKSDFRYKKFIPFGWKKTFSNLDDDTFGRYYYILKQTDDFKNFGRGKKLGVWDLPFMVVGSSMAVKYNDFISVGGFDDRFKGCWYEDTYLGAKLIVAGLKVIPIKNATSYHLIRNKKNSNTNKDKLIKNNRILYYELINEKLIKKTKIEFISNINKKYGSIITEIS